MGDGHTYLAPAGDFSIVTRGLALAKRPLRVGFCVATEQFK
jgi:hypothetical protein